MIKKCLFSFFSFCVLLISFTSASVVSPVGTYSDSFDPGHSLNIISKGSFLSQYIGLTKDILWIGNNNFYMWNSDGRLYAHIYGNYGYGSTLIEGYVQNYHICDYITGDNYNPTNCSNSSYNSSDIVSFLKTVKNGQDKYSYSQVYEQNNEVGYIWFCVGSSQYNKSLCFFTQYHRVGDCPNIGGQCEQLGDSLGLGYVEFGSFDGYSSPAVDGTSGSGGSTINTVISGDYNYYDCTYNDILTWMNTEGYSKYICYGGLDNFDLYDSSINYNPIPGSGLSISQIWSRSGSRAWDNFSQWFNFWNGIYRDSDNNYNAMWESYPAVYRTYFQLYNTYRSTEYGSVVSINNILNYCQLMENVNNPNFDFNSSVGGYFKPACESIVREKQTGVWNSRVDGSIYSDGVYTGDVPISVNWDGVGNMSGMSGSKDGLNFIQDFFNLNKTSLYNNYDDLTGIIPGYILIFLFGLILFRFISR